MVDVHAQGKVPGVPFTPSHDATLMNSKLSPTGEDDDGTPNEATKEEEEREEEEEEAAPISIKQILDSEDFSFPMDEAVIECETPVTPLPAFITCIQACQKTLLLRRLRDLGRAPGQ